MTAYNIFDGTDRCYDRQDANGSYIFLLDICDMSDTAYMSFDYSNFGGTPMDLVYSCGTRASERSFITLEQVQVCQELLKNKVAEFGTVVCDDDFSNDCRDSS